MVDIKAILAATVAAFTLPPPSLTMHRSIDGSHEEILPIIRRVLSAAAPEFEGPLSEHCE
jgi:hypothetical protein